MNIQTDRKAQRRSLFWTYRYFIIILGVDAFILAARPVTGGLVLRNTLVNFREMLAVIPPIFILLGLMDVWVPRERIIRLLGEGSGILGVLLSILLGAAAAGPLYAAFPAAGVMVRKGAKLSNVMIFLGAWSTLKIPMFLFEMSALGARFAVTRWLVSVVGILLMTQIILRFVPESDRDAIYRKHAGEAGSGF
ncbi:MAG: permease [Firmicutes bacterium]|jgi:uncharacterized membrane protein YraQ (UPF0718 family)|nr:permease [Bacillota bacterium]